MIEPTVCGYKTHPAADVFPMMDGDAFRDLVDDIRNKGLRQPVVMIGDKILDGRNRVRACVEIGIEPTFTHYEGDDPVGLVVSLNLKRRHLNETQRAMVAGRIANMRQGERTDLAAIEARSVSEPEAAAMLNVSRGSVQRARRVVTSAVPEVVAACDSGKLAVSAAAELSRLPEDRQRAIIAEAKEHGSLRRVRAMTVQSESAPEEAADDALVSDYMAQRSKAAAELDDRVRDAWASTNNKAEIARTLGVHPTTVAQSLRRQGLTKKGHPIQSLEKEARETAEYIASSVAHPELYLHGADEEDRGACIESLRALASAAKRAINWLNKEAIGG